MLGAQVALPSEEVLRRHEAMGLGVDQKISGVGENQNMMDEKRAAFEEE